MRAQILNAIVLSQSLSTSLHYEGHTRTHSSGDKKPKFFSIALDA